MQVQQIELHTVPSIPPGHSSLQQYPSCMMVKLQGPLCNCVNLGDHMHVTGSLCGAEFQTPIAKG